MKTILLSALVTIAALPVCAQLIPNTAMGRFYKNSDAGMNFIAGYECKNGLLFNINYSLGLANVYPKEPEVRKNAYIGISAGYRFRLWRR